MPTCLVALGSNLGDRAATLDAAIRDLLAAPAVEKVEASAWQLTLPVGASGKQPEFLNGVALVETSLAALDLFALLRQIETRHGRQSGKRWGNRALDLDLLLCGAAIIESPALTVPHPRMSFRRFVLEPAGEIAGPMIHPTIGWTLERLLDQLDSGSDRVALVSTDDRSRNSLAATLGERFGLKRVEASVFDEQLWPRKTTTWLAVPDGDVSSGKPKLSILLATPVESERDRGPVLRIGSPNQEFAERDAWAAVEAVWPRLGPAAGKRLQ
jgi:2-amino-4-hydroxy-6-hydroxymethyldihydropteridine diphosphokinase